jgi:hypothetical protein
MLVLFNRVLAFREGTNSQDKAIADFKQALEAALKPGEPVAFMYTAIHNTGTTHGPYLVFKPGHMDAMSASKGAVAIPLYTAPPALCHCKDRPASECHGEWEPGCDLGGNEAHARPYPPRLTDEGIDDAVTNAGHTLDPYGYFRAVESAVRRQFGVNDE